jgi:hypothetical protein
MWRSFNAFALAFNSLIMQMRMSQFVRTYIIVDMWGSRGHGLQQSRLGATAHAMTQPVLGDACEARHLSSTDGQHLEHAVGRVVAEHGGEHPADPEAAGAASEGADPGCTCLGRILATAPAWE